MDMIVRWIKGWGWGGEWVRLTLVYCVVFIKKCFWGWASLNEKSVIVSTGGRNGEKKVALFWVSINSVSKVILCSYHDINSPTPTHTPPHPYHLYDWLCNFLSILHNAVKWTYRTQHAVRIDSKSDSFLTCRWVERKKSQTGNEKCVKAE